MASPRSDVTDRLDVTVAPGGKVIAISDLHLPPERTTVSGRSCEVLARRLAAETAPLTVVLAGDIVEMLAYPGRAAADVLDAHDDLCRALAMVTERGGQVIYTVGNHDGDLAWDLKAATAVREATGAKLCLAADLVLPGGEKIRVEHGHQIDPYNCFQDPRNPLDTPLGHHIVREVIPKIEWLGRDWLTGAHEMADPADFPSFLASRLVYRKLVRHLWWVVLVPIVLFALVLPRGRPGQGPLPGRRPVAARRGDPRLRRARGHRDHRADHRDRVPPRLDVDQRPGAVRARLRPELRRAGARRRADRPGLHRATCPGTPTTRSCTRTATASTATRAPAPRSSRRSTRSTACRRSTCAPSSCPGWRSAPVPPRRVRPGRGQDSGRVRVTRPCHAQLKSARVELPGATRFERFLASARNPHSSAPKAVAAWPEGPDWPDGAPAPHAPAPEEGGQESGQARHQLRAVQLARPTRAQGQALLAVILFGRGLDTSCFLLLSMLTRPAHIVDRRPHHSVYSDPLSSRRPRPARAHRASCCYPR